MFLPFSHFPLLLNLLYLFSFVSNNAHIYVMQLRLAFASASALLFSILLFKGLPLFGFLIFQFKNAPTPLCLSRDKFKGHSGKNATVTPTKTLPKKQDYSPIIFQITLFTYKLDSFFKKKKKTYKLYSQNKNTGFFFAGKKKSLTTRASIFLFFYFLGFVF